jgi:hypothetical protein
MVGIVGVGGMLSMLGVAGLTIDVGHAYVVRGQVQNAVNAAGLAAAGYVYNTDNLTTAATVANTYLTDNPIPGLTATSKSVTTVCRNIMETPPWTCTTNPTANAVVVTETVSMPTSFMRVFGHNSLTVAATATASMIGAQQWNLAVIEDLTGSMGNTDSKCGMSQFECTLNGLQGFLAKANPCPQLSDPSGCTPAIAKLRVALFGFPNMIVDDLPSVNACSGVTYTLPLPFAVFTLPNPNNTSYAPLKYDYTYQNPLGTPSTQTFKASYEYTFGASDADANGFVSDYYQPSNTASGGLNTSSSLVQGIGYTGTSTKNGCMQLAANSIALNGAETPAVLGGGTYTAAGTIVNTTDVGEGITYLASAIYAAQSALIAEQNLMSGLGVVSHNAIILQSDGEMNTQWIYFPQGMVTQNPPSKYEPNGAYAARYNGNFANYNLPTAATIDPTEITGAYYTGFDTLHSTPNQTAGVAAHLSNPSLEATGVVNPLAITEAGGAIAGLYPDFLDECQQTIIAGQTATSKGIRVYSVAYGASASSGCGSGNTDGHNDVTLIPSSYYPEPLNVSFSSASALTPCIEMEDTATSLEYFYSYYPSGTSGACVDTDHTSSSIADIYASIQSSFGTPRLIPNGAS